MADQPERLRHRLALALVAAILVGVGGVIGIAASGGEEEHTATEPVTATSIGIPRSDASSSSLSTARTATPTRVAAARTPHRLTT